MNILICLEILWYIACLLVSFPLIKIIRDHIHDQPVANITVIDLTYSDCMVSIHVFGVIYSSSIVGCLMSDTMTLHFFPALILGEIMFTTVCYILVTLTITATLRFVTLVNNSEESGIQSLGPDDIAIWKIILFSLATAVAIPLIGLMFFQSIPSFSIVLFDSNVVPLSIVLSQDPYSYVYLVLIAIAVLTNVITKLYSTLILKTITPNSPHHFSLSVETALTFLLVIILQSLSTFLNRKYRFYFYYPIIFMFCCDIFPLMIIAKNKSMSKNLKDNILLFFDKFSCLFLESCQHSSNTPITVIIKDN